jgi:LAO/AO transport system kinase
MLDAARILERDPRALGRALTAIENREAGTMELLARLEPGAGLVVGITGPPGVGKSSLVDALAVAWREASKTVAVLAVDPSSRATGGALLGDRIRMQRHHADRGVFIRSMATRGAVGGLAVAAHQATQLLRAAGFDYILIETVGVGQDEIEVASLADVVVVVLVPGMGDDVQAIKAGVMEIADIFVINKADMPGAEKVAHEIAAMQGLAPAGHKTPIFKTVAIAAQGIAELIETINACPRRIHTRGAQVTIDHIGIAVKSIEAALPLYADVGFEAAARETVAGEKVHVAMLPAGTSRVELLEASEPDSSIARFIEKRGEGLHHIAIKVPDLAGAVERLTQRGARLIGTPQTGAGGHLYVFVHPQSMGGVLLELIQE